MERKANTRIYSGYGLCFLVVAIATGFFIGHVKSCYLQTKPDPYNDGAIPAYKALVVLIIVGVGFIELQRRYLNGTSQRFLPVYFAMSVVIGLFVIEFSANILSEVTIGFIADNIILFLLWRIHILLRNEAEVVRAADKVYNFKDKCPDELEISNQQLGQKEALQKVDFKLYVDGVQQAGGRVRGSIIALCILTLLMFVAMCTMTGMPWTELRLERAYEALRLHNYDKASGGLDDYHKNILARDQIYLAHIWSGIHLPAGTTHLDPLNNPADVDPYTETYKSLLNREINSWTTQVPLLGTSADINSLGIFIGLGLIVTSCILRLNLMNCIQSWNAARLAASRKGNDVREHLGLLLRIPVITSRYVDVRFHNGIKFLCILPFLAMGFCFFDDLVANFTILTLLGPWRSLTYYVIEFIILLAIARLSISNFLLMSFQIHKQVND